MSARVSAAAKSDGSSQLKKARSFLERLFRKYDGNIRYQFPLRATPIVNMVYDLFFDSTLPTFDSVKSLLDVLGLLCALLLGCVVGLVGSISYEDAVQADQRLYFGPRNSTTVMYWRANYTRPPSAQLYVFANNAGGIFFISILMVVYIYVDCAGKYEESFSNVDTPSLAQEQKPDKPDKPDNPTSNYDTSSLTPLQKGDLFYAWWSGSKYAILLVVVLTVVGCTFSVHSLVVLCTIKYPDYYIIETGLYNEQAFESPIAHIAYTFRSLFIACAVLCAFSCGLGTARKYNTMDMWEEEKAIAKEMGDKYGAKAQQKVSNNDVEDIR